jgi:hypothetical protein
MKKPVLPDITAVKGEIPDEPHGRIGFGSFSQSFDGI